MLCSPRRGRVSDEKKLNGYIVVMLVMDTLDLFFLVAYATASQ